MLFKCAFTLLCFAIISSIRINAKPSQTTTAKRSENVCGYKSCPVLNHNDIYVHIIPHSHDDVGWVQTVDEYYNGRGTLAISVKNIISTVIEELQKNPNRTFVQVESAYFWRWWHDHRDNHSIVEQLVNSGQLEFVGGAWSMNDEACTHYQSTIDQFTLGLRFLNNTFGACGTPRIGWQIDPFGHSREQASIFSQLGYDAIFMTRVDFRDKYKRMKNQGMEMIWQGSSNLGISSNIFTSIGHNGYGPPEEIYVGRREDVNSLVDMVNGYARYRKTRNIMIYLGADFYFRNAGLEFQRIDDTIELGNKRLKAEGKQISLIYSNPTCYVKAVHDEAVSRGITFPVKTDDFFPYASSEHRYWTGYFTSRPTQKRFERQGNNLLQVTKQIYGLVKALKSTEIGDVVPLQQAMGIMQHHDAITGTEKQYVADDYARIMFAAFEDAQSDLGAALKELIGINKTSHMLPFATCILANVSICKPSNEQVFIVAMYNPLSRPVSHYVRLPVSGNSYSIIGPNNETVNNQITPRIDSFEHIPTKKGAYDLVFLAKNLPPLGLKLYYVTKLANLNSTPVQDFSPDRLRLGTPAFGFSLNGSTGLLQDVTKQNLTIPVVQQFFSYNSVYARNFKKLSGAYIFTTKNRIAVPISPNVSFHVYKGDLLDEVHQTISCWVKQIIRVYKEENYIEFDWLVGPIPLYDYKGREIISRFTTNLKTTKTFYTDSNGREMLQRVRNFRPTFNYTNQEPIAGNYYPVTSRIVLKDVDKGIQFSVLTDRAEGGSSLHDGEVELMVHRRLLKDDGLGVDEALNEMEFKQGLVVRGQHYLIFGIMNESSSKTMDAKERDLAQRKILSPWTLVAPAKDVNLTQLQETYNFEFSGLSQALPENVQILTFEPLSSNGTFILRLEHVLEMTEDPILSKPAHIDITNMFSNLTVTTIRETTLGANKWIEDNIRLKWNVTSEPTEDSNNDGNELSQHENLNSMNITLNPMEIRTFIIILALN